MGHRVRKARLSETPGTSEHAANLERRRKRREAVKGTYRAKRVAKRENKRKRLDRVAHPERYRIQDFKKTVRLARIAVGRRFAFGDLWDAFRSERNHFAIDDDGDMSVWERMLAVRCTNWVVPRSDDVVGDLADRWLRAHGQ
jgi:hypothetical protein